MIFNFRITGKEDQIVQFEKELLDILLRLVENGDMLAHEIHFCIHESILNILQHSYKWNLELPIEIRLDISGGPDPSSRTLEIRIKDNGPAIEKVLEPPDKLDKFQMRKRGLYMISKIMDEFNIKPQGTTGNVTYMKKTLTQNSEEVLDIIK